MFDFLFTFDLQSGYHHVDIHPEHFKYLGFQWAEQDVPSYYDFTVLPVWTFHCLLFVYKTAPSALMGQGVKGYCILT